MEKEDKKMSKESIIKSIVGDIDVEYNKNKVDEVEMLF